MMDIYSPVWEGMLEKIRKEWVWVVNEWMRDKVVMREKIGEFQTERINGRRDKAVPKQNDMKSRSNLF